MAPGGAFPPTDPAQTPTVSHLFTLKNTTGAPIVIRHLQAACGCTTMLLTQGGSTASAVTVLPGKTAQVQMTLHLVGQEPGELLKYGWAYGDAKEAKPLATMALDVRVRPAFAFAPASLDFGAVALGTARALPLVSPSPWVHAALASGTAPAGMQALEVTLSAKAPPGPLQTQITITDPSGERLTLPVVAQIAP